MHHNYYFLPLFLSYFVLLAQNNDINTIDTVVEIQYQNEEQEEFIQTIPIWQCSDIDFSQFNLITKQRHGKHYRLVYKDPKTGYYYKKLSIGYSRIADFLKALKAGFYVGIAPLISILYEGDECCGYVARGGVTLRESSGGVYLQKEPNNLPHSGNLSIFKLFDNSAYKTNEAYLTFYNNILSATERTGFFHFDYNDKNLIVIDSQFQLIDLEAVTSLQELRKEFFNTHYNPHYYRQAIKEIWQKLISSKS